MGLADTANLIVDLSLKGNFKNQLNGAQRALGTFDAKLDRTQSRAFRAGQQIGTGIKNIARLSVVAASAGVGLAVTTAKIAGDFEAQLNTINTIARTTPQGLKAIGDSIRALARTTGTSLDDLTAGYYDLLSAGVKAADATKVLTAANTLAIGGLSTTAEAIDLLTTAINTYGGDARKAGRDSDIFAKAIERGKVTAAELASSFAQIGPIAAASKIGIDEIGAAYARLTAAGVPAAEAATAMRSAIIALTRRTSDLKALEKQTGRNYLSIAGSKGLVFALQLMRTDAAKAGVPLIDLLGRVEGLNFTLATTGPNFKAYNADLAAMGKATGTAAAQMAERQQGLNFQLARLKALSKDAAISIGSALLPKLTPLVAKFNEFVSGHQGDIERLGTSFAALFSDTNIEAGVNTLKDFLGAARDAAPAIAGAAQITGKAIGVAVGFFKALPPDIQKLAIAGLAINKLTGGLVTNLAGGLISSVLKQLVSGVVNVSGAVVNVVGGPGGVPAVPPPGGVPGSGLPFGIGVGAVGGITRDFLTDSMAKHGIPAFGGGSSSADRQLDSAALHASRSLLGLGSPAQTAGRNMLTLAAAARAARSGLLSMHTIIRNISRQGIKERGAAKIGGRDPSAAAIEKTLGHNINRLVNTIIKGTRSTEAKLADLRTLQRAVAARGDVKAAASIGKRINDLRAKTAAAASKATADASALKSKTADAVAASRRAGMTVTAATHNVPPPIVGAIRANRPIITTLVTVNVTAAQVSKSIAVQSRYGPSNGSAGGGKGTGGSHQF